MEALRAVLKRLGWPVDVLSDSQINDELFRRWFRMATNIEQPALLSGSASAVGVVAATARLGNLDALCWVESTEELAADDPCFDHPDLLQTFLADKWDPPEFDSVERRSCPRTQASEYVEFFDQSAARRSSGWLVDVSDEGAAFIVEFGDVPAVGAEVAVTLRLQTGVVEEPRLVRVVRTECLTENLALVCGQAAELWNAADDAVDDRV